MAEVLHLEDVRNGDRWISPCRTVTKDDVASFAHLTGDYNPLHEDGEFARNSPFRKPIAHGLLGLAFTAGLSSESPLVDTVAFLGVSDWQFLKPVFFGDCVHVITEVLEIAPQGRKRGRVVWQRSLVNQNGETVQTGKFETLITRRAAAQERPQSEFQHRLMAS
jgi:acyl dehydratase